MSSGARIKYERQNSEDANAPPESNLETDDKSQFPEHGTYLVQVSTLPEADHRESVNSGEVTDVSSDGLGEVQKLDFMHQSNAVASWLDEAFQIARNDPGCKFHDTTCEPGNIKPTNRTEQSHQVTSFERPSSIFGLLCTHKQQSDSRKENDWKSAVSSDDVSEPTPIMQYEEVQSAATNVQDTNSFCKSPTEEDRQNDIYLDPIWDDPSIEVDLPDFDSIPDLPDNRTKSRESNSEENREAYINYIKRQEMSSALDYDWKNFFNAGKPTTGKMNVWDAWELEIELSKREALQQYDEPLDTNIKTPESDSDTECKHSYDYAQHSYAREPKNVASSWSWDDSHKQPTDADRQTDNSAFGRTHANANANTYSKKEKDFESGFNFNANANELGILRWKPVGLPSPPRTAAGFDVPCRIDQFSRVELPNAGKHRYNRRTNRNVYAARQGPELPYGYDQKAFERDEADFLAAAKNEYELNRYTDKDKQASDYTSTYTSGQDHQYADFGKQAGETSEYQYEFEQASRMTYNYPPPPLGEDFGESAFGLERGYDYQDNSGKPGYGQHNKYNQNRGGNKRYVGMNTRSRWFTSTSEPRYNPNPNKYDHYLPPKYGSHYTKPQYKYDKNINQHSQYEWNRDEAAGPLDQNRDSESQEGAHSLPVYDTLEKISDQQGVPTISNENNSLLRKTFSKRRGSKGKHFKAQEQKEEHRTPEKLKKEISQAKSNEPNNMYNITELQPDDTAHKFGSIWEAPETHREKYQHKTKKAETKKPELGIRK